MVEDILRVAIYCRLSDEDRDKQSEEEDSQSIQNQKSMLLKYALDHNWEVYKIYSDDDYTGADRRRPEFNKLLEDAKNRKFNIVLCKTQSRFTRELELVEKYIHGLFPLWGIRFVSIVDNADTANKGNKKSRQINGLVNEWYLEDMSENIKSVLTDRRVNGHHIGAFALYGYKKDPDIKGHLIIDDEAAAIVREIFTLFSQGYGKTNIARILNDRGVPNPTEYKRLKGLRYKPCKGKTGTLWKYFAISDMLVNEIYIGNMVQGKYGSISYKSKINKPRPKELWYRKEGTHEPIIDIELWNKVQSMVKEKAKPFVNGEVGLFARKTFCMNCGYTMRSSKAHGKHYLKCTSKHIAKDACIGAFVGVDTLENVVLNEIKELSRKYLDKDALEQNIKWDSDLQDKIKTIEKENETYAKKLGEYTKGLKELYLDKVKGIISESDYLDLSKDFSSQKEKMESLINENKEKIEMLKLKIQNGENRRILVEKYTNLDHLTREIVEELIEKIDVGKRDPVTRELPIEIHWKF